MGAVPLWQIVEVTMFNDGPSWSADFANRSTLVLTAKTHFNFLEATGEFFKFVDRSLLGSRGHDDKTGRCRARKVG